MVLFGRERQRGRRLALGILCGLLCLPFAIKAGPYEYGMGELKAAMAARQLKKKVQAEVSAETNRDTPETFSIEPDRFGGARISGGDLRGLLYGLLEAAEQIRSSGKFLKARGTPASSLRGVRLVASEQLAQVSDTDWQGYFRMLARQHFNRAELQLERIEPPYTLVQTLSKLSAEYGIDFTLGLAGAVDSADLAAILKACPQVRSVAAPLREEILEVLQNAGRRVTLDVRAGQPEATAYRKMLLEPRWSWPASFVAGAGLDLPSSGASRQNPVIDFHELYYALWGRAGYGISYLQTQPPSKNETAVEKMLPSLWPAMTREQADGARQLLIWTAALTQSRSGGSDYLTVFSAAPGPGSAKYTPGEIVFQARSAAAALAGTNDPDIERLLAVAQKEIAGIEPTPRPSLPTEWTHAPQETVTADKDLEIALKLSNPATISTVRLRYRLLAADATETVAEMPAGDDVRFVIPAVQLDGHWDLRYYFELIGRDGQGWFAPDPLKARPWWDVRVQAPHSGNN